MSLPLAVAWPVFVVAFGAAAALAACAWVGAIALLARSDGDAELRSAAARWREDAHADWRGRTRSMVVLVLALGVVGLVAASGASARVAWCAALIGSGAVLLAEWMALRMAGALVPRMAAAATGGATEAAAVAARGERIGAATIDALLLALAGVACTLGVDGRAWLAAAAAAWATALLRSGATGGLGAAVAHGGGALARGAVWLALPALHGGAELVAAAVAWRAAVAALALLGTRVGAPHPGIAEAAAALVVPPFFAELLARHAGNGVAVAWAGGSVQLPLLLGIAAWPLLEPLATWQSTRAATRGADAGRAGAAASWLVWCGALLALSDWLGGASGPAWLALGFLTVLDRCGSRFTVACREEAATLPGPALDRGAPAVAPGTLAGFGELLVVAALALQLAANGVAGRPVEAAAPLAAALAGGFAAVLLQALLERARGPVPADGTPASTEGPARAMIPALAWTAIVALGLPRTVAAELGSAFGGMLLVGGLALPLQARMATGSRLRLPRWMVVIVLLAALAAAVPDGR